LGTKDDKIEISTEEELDGQTAKRKVDEQEEAERLKGGKRGPAGKTRQHWYEPIRYVLSGVAAKKWKFKCKYCPAYAPVLYFYSSV
jgi:hypothetical protein